MNFLLSLKILLLIYKIRKIISVKYELAVQEKKTTTNIKKKKKKKKKEKKKKKKKKNKKKQKKLKNTQILICKM